MLKKHKYFLTISLIAIFFLLSDFCIAVKLEATYPTIEGQTLTSASTFPEYLKYLFDFGMYLGFGAVFLSLVIAGILYLVSPISPETRARAKDYASGALSGLLLLTTLYLIVTTINPALRIFKLEKLPKIPEPSTPPFSRSAGVYFYDSGGCPYSSDKPQMPAASNVSDLGALKNRVRSVEIVHNPESNLYYIAVLYDQIKYTGKCQYINPNAGCKSVEPFAASASIYRYSHTPKGNGVTFYRKSFFNEKGGWFKVENSEINQPYIRDLGSLKFKEVPKEEQECVEWDLEGKCTKKEEKPSLAGENITSIKIDGNYFVMLINYNSQTSEWTACQAFPTDDDANKEGPLQIKWEYIRQQGLLPNWVLIFPVYSK